jgi:murein DD-endopeptidase MepM/ murein hydrolase activator NlpD
VQQADGPRVRASDFYGAATRARQRRSLQRVRAYSARSAAPQRPVHTHTLLAVPLLAVAALLAGGAVTHFVSAESPDLRLEVASMPGLPSASLAVYPPAVPATQVATSMAAHMPVAAAAAPSVASAAPAATPAAEASAATPDASATPAAEPAEASDQRQTALSATQSAPPPLYVTYTVQAGDTVSGIAQAFGVRTKDIVANNLGVISGQSLLVVGATLQVPSAPGVLHNVRVGETLDDIASMYGVTLDDIVGFAGNQIDDPSALLEGQQILVVNGEIPGAAVPAAAVAEPTPPPAPTPPPPPRFIWPVVGPISSYFGPSHPKGIDIAVAYVPVAASAAGKVVFVGGDACCSYGYYIDIQHADGFLTRYGHLSRFMVKLGQYVDQGETIAISGNTGYSTGGHVHFEIQKNGVVQNPLDYLP